MDERGDRADERSEQEDEERFAAELIRRGEAARRDEAGRLPPGATHEIVQDDPDKPPRIARRRFSLG